MQQYGPTHIITKDGECRIALVLELNINVNSNGALTVSGTPTILPPKPPKTVEIEEDDVNWAIPDFTNDERITFGKKVEE